MEQQIITGEKKRTWIFVVGIVLAVVITAFVVGSLVWVWQGAQADEELTDVKGQLYTAQLQTTRATQELEQVIAQQRSVAVVKESVVQEHSHEQVEIAADAPVPTLSAVVEEDAKSGWNIQLVTTNFAFAPERASGEHVVGEGHAHVYIDGVKIGRVYGPWYHVDGYTEGVHTVRVTLNANDHREYAIGGAPVEYVTEVEQEAAEVAADDHVHAPGTPPHDH